MICNCLDWIYFISNLILVIRFCMVLAELIFYKGQGLMKAQVYFLFLISFYSSLMSMAIQENDAIFNGFKQFLGEIYLYESKQLIGGLSKNTQYLCLVNDKKYLVRILGESFSKRQNEVNIHCLAADNGIAPKVYYYDDEYSFIIMDFIEGHTLFLEEANRPEVLDCVVEKIRLISQFDGSAFIHENAWNLIAQINKDYNKIKNQPHVTLNCMIEQMFNAIKIIYQSLEDEQRRLVFCHNDLNYRNIFFTKKDVVFIDWEMAGLNYELYDFAYYSVFSCLSESDDYYLFTKYLERIPSSIDLDYFKRIKLMIRACNAFYILAFLEHIPTFIPMESIKNLEFYARTFAQDATVISPEFLYSIAICQMRIFVEDYKKMIGE